MRALRRIAVAVTAVAVASTTQIGIWSATAAPGSPTTSVSKVSGLTDGETVTVSGTGFSTDGPGIYVGLVQDDLFTHTDAGVWNTTAYVRPTQIVDGSWTTTVELAAVKGAANCYVNTCSIYTVAAHGSADRSQDTRTEVRFTPPPTTPPTTTPAPPTTTPAPPTTTPAPPTTTQPPTTTTQPPTTTTRPPTTTTRPPTSTPTTPPPASTGPRVTASRTTGLNAAGDTITVRGSGFSTSGPGVYVGVAQMDRFSSTNADVFHGTKYVKPGDMPGGSFSVQLDVVGAFPAGDCVANRCAIYTIAAHGSSDRSQDTVTPISFVGAAPVVPQGGGGNTSGGNTSGGNSTGGGAAAAAPGTTYTANPGLSVSLSKSSEIDPAGETVTVSGAGFSGVAPGIYVGLVQDNVFSHADASTWMSTAYVKPEQISGGTWSVPLELVAVQGGFDCVKNSCSIYTVMAHGSSDRSQDTKTPVTFVGGVAPGTVTAPPAGVAAAAATPAGTAAVTVSKARGLKVEGEEITVSGSGFATSGPGVYVGLAQEDKFSTTDAGTWITAAYVTPDKIEGGAWTTTLKVQAIKGDSDCTKNPCSIYTIAAHGSSDRSQDTVTPVSFGDDPNAPNADKAAEAALTAADGSDDGGSSSANESSSSTGIRNLSEAFSGGTGWILPLLVGAAVGAGVAVAVTALIRRKAPTHRGA